MNLKIRNKTFYDVFLGLLIKEGNKLQAKKLLDTSFLIVSKQVKLPINHILLKLVLYLNSFVEIKKIKSKRSTHFVPFPLSINRKSYLMARWIISSVNEDKRKISFSLKLSEEILNIILKKSAKSLTKKNLNFKQSLQNKSNTHFRW